MPEAALLASAMSLYAPKTQGTARGGSPVTTGEPTVAVLLTWFVPGAGHLYLGRPGFALIAFTVIDGLYLLGLKLSNWMGFEFLAKELRSALAPALSPEAGNLGGFLLQMKRHGFGIGEPEPFPTWIHLGVALTALSGVLNLCLMVQAHLDARRPPRLAAVPIDWRRSPAFACFLAWLVPGLGHLWQKRPVRAALVFLVLVGLLVFGTALAQGSNLSRERHFYYWGGQFLAGLPALLLETIHGHPPVRSFIPYAEAGLVMGSIAGMLNVLAMLDVYSHGEEAYLHPERAAAEPSSAPSEAAA